MEQKRGADTIGSEGLDGDLIAEFIKSRYPRVPGIGTQAGLIRASGVGKSTLERLLKRSGADPTFGIGSLRRLEPFLDLPFGALEAIGAHDLRELSDTGASPEVLGWLARKVNSQSSGAVSNGG
jgi:hypothetical protein